MNIADLIRTIPDYPKPGIMFRDITTLLSHPEGFKQTIQLLVDRYQQHTQLILLQALKRADLFWAHL